eukprot:scaffold3321_cov90-Isochrysis_galbana.AAC.1
MGVGVVRRWGQGDGRGTGGCNTGGGLARDQVACLIKVAFLAILRRRPPARAPRLVLISSLPLRCASNESAAANRRIPANDRRTPVGCRIRDGEAAGVAPGRVAEGRHGVAASPVEAAAHALRAHRLAAPDPRIGTAKVLASLVIVFTAGAIPPRRRGRAQDG